jgi:hypothetical protein
MVAAAHTDDDDPGAEDPTSGGDRNEIAVADRGDRHHHVPQSVGRGDDLAPGAPCSILSIARLPNSSTRTTHAVPCRRRHTRADRRPPDARRIRLRRRRARQRWHGATLFVDGNKIAQGRVDATVPMIFSADETCDLGGDTASPVADDYPADRSYTAASTGSNSTSATTTTITSSPRATTTRRHDPAITDRSRRHARPRVHRRQITRFAPADAELTTVSPALGPMVASGDRQSTATAIRLRSLLRRETLRDDGVAGVVLGVESVPDGLADGLLAGVNPSPGCTPTWSAPSLALATNSSFMASTHCYTPGRLDGRSLAIGITTIALIVILERTRLGPIGLVLAIVATSAAVMALGWNGIAQLADLADVPRSLSGPVLPDLKLVVPLAVPAISLAFVGLVQGRPSQPTSQILWAPTPTYRGTSSARAPPTSPAACFKACRSADQCRRRR